MMAVGAVLILVAAGQCAAYLWEDQQAQAASENALSDLRDQMGPNKTAVGWMDPNRAMDEVEIDGIAYVGTISISSVDLDLPVASAFSYDVILTAPARYSGSVYADDMVILAHSYASHFAKLYNIAVGDEVVFTTVTGEMFSYVVTYCETVEPTQVDEMIDPKGDWDLTLFTCTSSGSARWAVRCDRK